MYKCAQKNERLTHLFMRIFLLVLFPDFHVVVIVFIGRAKRAPHWGVQSRFRVIYICIYICMSVCLVCHINCVGGIM